MIHYLFLIGITVEAMTGALAAGRKNMDMMGAIMIGVVTGLGGGAVRDLLLDRHPLSWIDNPRFVVITATAAFLTIIFSHWLRKLSRIFLILDALGLATFSVVGTKIGIDMHLSPVIIAVVAMINGACGGMLRDILCNDVPLVLRKELYAIVALFASVLYMTINYFYPDWVGTEIFTIASAFILRLCAIYWHLELPKFHYDHSIH
tara:strand:+ start:128867 stop:129481 length:615 start_codon:yes stop_codon:yes gene_type:complete